MNINKYYDKFDLYDIFHPDSKWKNMGLKDFIFILQSEGYRPFSHFLNPRKYYQKRKYYVFKTTMQQFKNGYIDEAYRTFDQYKHMDSASSPYYIFAPKGISKMTNIRDTALKNATLWTKARKWILEQKADDQTVLRFLTKKLVLQNYKQLEETTFSDKNTVFKKIPYPVINFLTSQTDRNYNKFFHRFYLPFLYQWLQIPISERQKYKIIISSFNVNQKIGVQDDQYFYLQPGHLYQFPIVYRPIPSQFHKTILNTCIPYLKKHLYNNTISQRYQQYEKIFIHRRTSTAGHAFIENIEDVANILKNIILKLFIWRIIL